MKRNSFIDILKALCVLFIILDHYTNWGSIRDYLLFPYWVTMAVPMLMILSGYLYAFSYQNRQIDSLQAAYRPRLLVHHLIRFVIPFFIVYLFELGVSAISNDFSSVFPKWIHDLPLGGWGPGAYYTPIMLQFVFVFPLIFLLIRKFDAIGVCICAVFNILFELFQWSIHMDGILYKTLLFRYTLLIAFGCYFAIGRKKLSRFLSVAMCLIGGIYIFCYSYVGYQPTILSKWTGTNFIAALFIIPIAFWLLDFSTKKETHNRLLEMIGKASYNVYLVQMVYFNYIAQKLYTHIDIMPLSNLINLVVCSTLGICFYWVEHKLIRYNAIDTIFSKCID